MPMDGPSPSKSDGFFQENCHFGVYLASAKTWFFSLLIGRCSKSVCDVLWMPWPSKYLSRECVTIAVKTSNTHEIHMKFQCKFRFPWHTDIQCCRKMPRRNVISTLVAGQRIDLDADKRLACRDRSVIAPIVLVVPLPKTRKHQLLRFQEITASIFQYLSVSFSHVSYSQLLSSWYFLYISNFHLWLDDHWSHDMNNVWKRMLQTINQAVWAVWKGYVLH